MTKNGGKPKKKTLKNKKILSKQENHAYDSFHLLLQFCANNKKA